MYKAQKNNGLLFVGIFLLAGILSQPIKAQPSGCGDSNGDGTVNIGDLITDIEYLFNGGSSPVDFDTADFDGLQLLSVGDAQALLTCIFTCGTGTWGTCAPTGSSLSPTLDESIELRFPNRIPANTTSFDLALTMVNAPRYEAFSLPISITVNGALAQVDSITFPAAGSVFEGGGLGVSSIPSPGVVSLGLVTVPNGSLSSVAVDVPALIHLSLAASASESVVEVNWETLSPVQAPTQDSSIYPLFLKFSGDEGFVPVLQGTCCIVAGDADDDGSFNVADVTYLIARILSSGPPITCPSAADSNADNAVNIADVTFNIARIFSGGPAPVCGS